MDEAIGASLVELIRRTAEKRLQPQHSRDTTAEFVFSLAPGEKRLIDVVSLGVRQRAGNYEIRQSIPGIKRNHSSVRRRYVSFVGYPSCRCQRFADHEGGANLYRSQRESISRGVAVIWRLFSFLPFVSAAWQPCKRAESVAGGRERAPARARKRPAVRSAFSLSTRVGCSRTGPGCDRIACERPANRQT